MHAFLRAGARALAATSLALALGATIFGTADAAPRKHSARRAPLSQTLRRQQPVGNRFRHQGIPADARELVRLRTATSRTFVAPHGSRTELVYPAPINYRDSSGRWQPIDSRLVRSSQSGYAYRNMANHYRLELPAELQQRPVEISSGKDMIAFRLEGASGTPDVSGAAAAYTKALPKTDLSYQATSEAVKETLTLAGPGAPRSFRYALTTGAGLTPSLAGNGAVVFRKQGRRVAAFAPPFMVDAGGKRSDAVATRLTRSGSGYLLTVTPSRRWLSSPGRAWPVRLDPTVTFQGASVDCYLSSATPDTSLCGGPTLRLGYDGATKYRSLLKFDPDPVRTDVILDAELGLYIQSKTTANAAAIGAYQLTRAFDTTATWNRAATDPFTGVATPWTTPGGDFVSTPAATNPSVGGSTGSFSFQITQLVQAWVDGSIENDGVLLKQVSEATNNVLTLGSSSDGVPMDEMPWLKVSYDFGEGAWARYTQVASQQLDDHLGLSVNPATGNLLVEAHDFSLAGLGPDVGFDRYYNGLGSGMTADGGGEFMWDWTMGDGVDTYLEFFDDGGVGYHDGTGTALPFIKSGSGLISPNALEATLVRNGDGSYTLTHNADGSRDNFNSDGLLSSRVDANGNAVSYSYIATPPNVCCPGPWELTGITDTSGRTTTLSYDSNGLLTTVTDPVGRLYRYGYDPTNFNLISYTDPAGGITRYAWSAGKLSRITDPKGNVTKLGWNVNLLSSVTRVTNPSAGTGPTTSFTYNDSDPTPNTVVTDPNGHNTTYYYDHQSRVTRVVDAFGKSTSVDYTSANGGSGCADDNICSATDALGNKTTFGYDSNNNLLWSQSPLEGTSNRPTFAYANANHPFYASKYTDPQGGIWNYNYDESTGNLNGNLTSKTEGSGGQNPVRFTYNFGSTTHPNGTIATATDAKGAVTTYSYVWDTANPRLLKQMTVNPPAPLTATTITYDSLGRVASEVDGNGNTRSYTYDALDRVTQVTYTNGGISATISSVYDLNGNVSSLTDNTGTTSDTYDPLNRLTKETRPDTSSTTYTYDNGSNLSSLTDAGGTTSYLYDADDRLTKITEPNSNQTTFGYDDNGNRTTITYPGSVTGTIGYDASQRISSVTWKKGTTTLAFFNYCYRTGTTAPNCTGGSDSDLRRWVVSQIPGDSQSTTTTYGYDGLNRLTSANSSGGSTSTYSYVYDVNGNRKQQTVNGSSTFYLYNGANELCWSGATDPGPGGNTCVNPPSGGKTYSHDGNGNMLTGSSDSFAYNLKNQTSSVTPNGGTAIPMTYTGPGQGRRTGAGGTSYVNDALGVASEGSTYYVRDISGTVVGERNPVGGSGSYYFLFDGLGSVVSVCDATGVVKDTFKYSPFGESVAASAPIADPWRFAGGYLDSQTSLYKMGDRYYDQSLGRWTQVDAVNDPLNTYGWNRYTYVGNDPINRVDLAGSQAEPIICTPFFTAGQSRRSRAVIARGVLECDEPGTLVLQLCITRVGGPEVCGTVNWNSWFNPRKVNARVATRCPSRGPHAFFLTFVITAFFADARPVIGRRVRTRPFRVSCFR